MNGRKSAAMCPPAPTRKNHENNWCTTVVSLGFHSKNIRTPVADIRMKEPMVSVVAQVRDRIILGADTALRIETNFAEVGLQGLDITGRNDRADIAVGADRHPIAR